MIELSLLGSDPDLGTCSFAEAKRPVSLCKPSPCMNEGTCILKNGSYRCECWGGWEGPHCENREWIPIAQAWMGVVSLVLPSSTDSAGGRSSHSIIYSFPYETLGRAYRLFVWFSVLFRVGDMG